MALKKTDHARSAAEFIPSHADLSELKAAAASCRGCDLYKRATQTVFGEGSPHARIVFVGEQPGDQEDRAGRPFVGPAGKLLDQALAAVGISREEIYITNAVKHFKWEPQGKRRKGKQPSVGEITACKPWLIAELSLIRPKMIVCLGTVAIQSVFGRPIRLYEVRGTFLKTPLAPETFVTIHPSAILRIPNRDQQQEEYRRFVDDLRRIQAKLLELQSQTT
ncbi:MAG: uracil-DNA glycosylase [Nitrospiraceae bacterium]